MRRTILFPTATLLALILGFAGVATSQEGSRSIVSEDFVKTRPAGPAMKKPTPTLFNQSAKEPRVARRKKTPPPTAPKTDAPPQMVGVTLWKLRKARVGESDAHGIRVQNPDGTRELRIAVRSSLSKPLALNDVIRLTVEAQREGYLYIVDSEMRRDGTVGSPVLIFPDSSRVDNFIRPGMLVEFPDRSEELPYFRVSSNDANYAGELLTVIIAPKPIAEWNLGRAGEIRNLDFLSLIEERAPEATRFERSEGVDGIETEDERVAATGNRTRSLGNGNETTYRQLTRDNPLPQTLYETRTNPGELVVVPIRLLAAGGGKPAAR